MTIASAPLVEAGCAEESTHFGKTEALFLGRRAWTGDQIEGIEEIALKKICAATA
jgi:hypothetical protein